MKERVETSPCERSNDLVSFLYGELDQREVVAFEQHLVSCAACSEEVAAFRKIRSGVIAWREQSLGMSPSPASTGLTFAHDQKPSALAAIRQFFAFSPVWLKGAVAFASLLFFAALAMLILNLSAKPVAPLASNGKVYSEDEMRAKVEAGIQARLQQLNSSQPPAKKESPATALHSKPRVKSANVFAKTRRAPLTKAEREQLAADLRLISLTEDSDLNLLGEQINR